MPETVYTTQRIFDTISGERILSVQVNGGSLTVECQHGDGTWVEAKSYTDDAVESMEFMNRTFRFTPAGGATYAL